jgi:hypothetical protein
VTSAAAPMPARTADRLRSWLSVRHSLPAEAAVVLALYGLYEVARGLVVGEAGVGSNQQRFLAVMDLPFEPEVALPSILAGKRKMVGERFARFIVGVLEDEQAQRHDRHGTSSRE